jgi:hypothetical protein
MRFSLFAVAALSCVTATTTAFVVVSQSQQQRIATSAAPKTALFVHVKENGAVESSSSPAQAALATAWLSVALLTASLVALPPSVDAAVATATPTSTTKAATSDAAVVIPKKYLRSPTDPGPTLPGKSSTATASYKSTSSASSKAGKSGTVKTAAPKKAAAPLSPPEIALNKSKKNLAAASSKLGAAQKAYNTASLEDEKASSNLKRAENTNAQAKRNVVEYNKKLKELLKSNKNNKNDKAIEAQRQKIGMLPTDEAHLSSQSLTVVATHRLSFLFALRTTGLPFSCPSTPSPSSGSGQASCHCARGRIESRQGSS